MCLPLSASVESSAVQTLKVSAVSTSTAVISWNSVPGATGYRLAWGPTPGDSASVKNIDFTVRNNQWTEEMIVLLMTMLFPEFVGRDRPRQLALNGSTTEYHLKNVAHNTEYVLTLYVLFGSVVGPGISATFRTCEYRPVMMSVTH